MAKLPTVERFRISLETDIVSLGPVMAQLAKIPGVAVTGNELITDVRRFQKNSTIPKDGIPSSEFLTGWVKDHPTFTTSDATAAFEIDGRVKTGAYGAIKTLIEKGILKKLADGHYARADVKQLAAPKKRRVAKGAPKTFDKRGEDVVLSYAKRNHGRFNAAKLVEIFTREGRAKNSVYASIDALMKQKIVKRVGEKGEGQYVLLNKPAPKPKPKPVVVNGHAAETTPETGV
jgi:hypothetical protein